MTIPYTRGLHRLSDTVFAYLQPDGSWGLNNAGLIVGERAAVVVDTLYDTAHTRAFAGAVQEVLPKGISVSHVVNTHANGDHWYGNHVFEGASIVASKRCREEMRQLPPAKMALLLRLSWLLGKGGRYAKKAFDNFSYKGIPARYPDLVYEGNHCLDPGGIDVEIRDMGACHTQSDAIVHVKGQGIVFAADLLFINGTPIAWTGPIREFIAVLDRLAALDADTYVPGHGPVTPTAGIGQVREYFEFVLDQGRPRLEKGMSLIEAALDMDLGPFSGWTDPERIIINLHCLERELFPKRKALSPIKLFGLMAAWQKKAP